MEKILRSLKSLMYKWILLSLPWVSGRSTSGWGTAGWSGGSWRCSRRGTCRCRPPRRWWWSTRHGWGISSTWQRLKLIFPPLNLYKSTLWKPRCKWRYQRQPQPLAASWCNYTVWRTRGRGRRSRGWWGRGCRPWWSDRTRRSRGAGWSPGGAPCSAQSPSSSRQQPPWWTAKHRIRFLTTHPLNIIKICF